MAPRIGLRVLGLVPGAAGLQQALERFRAGGRGAVIALNTDLLRCLAGMMDEDDEIERLSLADAVKRSILFCGESAPQSASRGLIVAALANASEALDSDSPFFGSARFAGFHKAAARALSEVHEWNLGVEDLRRAAEGAKPETAAKLLSLADMHEGATEVLAALGRPWEKDALDALLASATEQPPFPRVLVMAGSCGTPRMAKFILWLVENGCDVTVALDNPLAGQRLFANAGRFALTLGAEVERVGRPHGLCEALFAGPGKGDGPQVTVMSCADSLSEAEWVLRSCLKDLETGLHPEEIAIYVRNLDEYGCFLESAALRLDVPIRISRRAPVLSNRFARLVQETLEFCASDDPRKLIPLLQCSYLGLSRKLAVEVQEAARTAFKAKRNAWPILLGWAEGHQDEVPWLYRLLLWREDALKGSLPLFAWTDRLRALMDIVPWQDGASHGPSRTRDIRAQTVLGRSVADVASIRRISSDRIWSLREFAQLCPELWKGESYVLPSSPTGVQVANNAESIGPVKSVYALGMLEGLFPRRRSEDPILNDEDRAEVSRGLGLDPPLPSSFDGAMEERDEFYRLCSAAQTKLTFSYPQTDDTRDNVPAFYLGEVKRVWEGRIDSHDYPRVPFAPPQEECRAAADRAMRGAMEAPREEPLPVRLATAEAKAEISWPSDKPFTPQDLKGVMRCEFRHLVSRRLGIKPSRESSRWFTLRKLPQAVRLVQQPTPDLARNALEQALEAELDLLYGDAPDWEIALMRSGGKQVIAQWVKREFTSRELWKKDPDTVNVDLPFGAPGIHNKMPGGVPISGDIAAISRMGPYAVCHLYETQGPTQESTFGGPLGELDTLYYGLYLLSRHGAAEASAIEVESMSGKRTMLLLPRLPDYPVPARHQDHMQVVDLGSGMEGSIAKKGFYDEVKQRLKRAVMQLHRGGVDPMPGEQCTWCGYGELCRRSHEFGEDARTGVEDDVSEYD